MDENRKLIEELIEQNKKLIKATNRTTNAVRALALPTFVLIPFAVVAYLILMLGNFSSWGWSAFIFVVGCIIALVLGYVELSLSKE